MDTFEYGVLEAQRNAERRHAIASLREQAAKARGNRRKLEELAFRCWDLGVAERTIIAISPRLTVDMLRDVVRREVGREHDYEQALSASRHAE